MCLHRVSLFFSLLLLLLFFFFFFFNDTATTEIYTLSLHDALPICLHDFLTAFRQVSPFEAVAAALGIARSEEHTSELQSRLHLVCRLLLEKKKKKKKQRPQLYTTERYTHYHSQSHIRLRHDKRTLQ